MFKKEVTVLQHYTPPDNIMFYLHLWIQKLNKCVCVYVCVCVWGGGVDTVSLSREGRRAYFACRLYPLLGNGAFDGDEPMVLF